MDDSLLREDSNINLTTKNMPRAHMRNSFFFSIRLIKLKCYTEKQRGKLKTPDLVAEISEKEKKMFET